MRKLCCSKKLVVMSWATTLILTILTVVGVFFTEKDVTPLLTIASLSWAETAASTGFYYWKARTENKIKLTKAMLDDWADKYGVEAVISLAGIIVNE